MNIYGKVIAGYRTIIKEQEIVLSNITKEMAKIFKDCNFEKCDFNFEVDIYGKESWHEYGLRNNSENITIFEQLNKTAEDSGIKKFIMALSHILENRMSVNVVIHNFDKYSLLLNRLSSLENTHYNSNDHVAYKFQDSIVIFFWYLSKDIYRDRTQKKEDRKAVDT